MKHQIRVFKNEATKQAYASAYIDGMANEDAEKAHDLFKRTFQTLKADDFTSELLFIEGESNFEAYVDVRLQLRNKNYNVLTQVEYMTK